MVSLLRQTDDPILQALNLLVRALPSAGSVVIFSELDSDPSRVRTDQEVWPLRFNGLTKRKIIHAVAKCREVSAFSIFVWHQWSSVV